MWTDAASTGTVPQTVARARRHSYADLLTRSARRHPDKLALIDGARRLTFAEFDRAVDRVAAGLHRRGLRHGDRLALLSRNCWQYGVLAFATARIGVVLVPVNFMLTADEIAYILGHSGAVAMVTSAEFRATSARALGSNRDVRLRGVLGGTGADGWDDIDAWTVIAGSSESDDAPPPDVAVGDDDPLRLMYTSGTESRPKGVMLSSRSLISQYVSCIADGGMTADDVELHSLPLYHCAQLDCFFSVDVYLGATSILLPGPEPLALLATIERERVTKLFCPPTVWISLLRSPAFDSTDLTSLRKGYYGASAMPVEVLRELRRRLPDVALWNFYGQTEMAPLATILRPHEQLERAGSPGIAALNVETRVVDEVDEPVPAGQVGEIVHRSPHAALGYYNDPDKTAEAFRNGWFHSGDLGVLTDDGYLAVVDRKKDMIKTGGENVASREVEEAIYELEGVAEVAVFGVSHPQWIEAVVAVIVPKADSGLTEAAVEAHARTRLAGYKRPKYVVLVDALPKNPSGKILKRELRDRHASIAGGDNEADDAAV
jgi:fatty-acyl-CoA synthase